MLNRRDCIHYHPRDAQRVLELFRFSSGSRLRRGEEREKTHANENGALLRHAQTRAFPFGHARKADQLQNNQSRSCKENRIMIKSKSIAGIAIPDSKLTNEAADVLREYGTPLLWNHSHRVFLCF